MSAEEEDEQSFVEFEEDSNDVSIPSEESYELDADEEAIDAAAAPTVLYVGHIPYGFFEKEMKDFFSQFGRVMKVRLARSDRTARCKGYGWVRFADATVAAIAQRTMDGYIMFKKKLVCQLVPPEKVHPHLFRGAFRKKLPSNRGAVHRAKVNGEVTTERRQKLEAAELQKQKKRNKQLAELGIDYSFGAVEEKREEEKAKKTKRSKKQK